ncbi:MAG: hypothetical protein WBN68_08830 [Sedimenticolaceae bacterium]
MSQVWWRSGDGKIRKQAYNSSKKSAPDAVDDLSSSSQPVACFEDIVIAAVSKSPQARAILVIGGGTNEIDVCGEERVREAANR